METTEKTNYTPEQVETMRTMYLEAPSRETVEKLAEMFSKSVRSIVGKLSKEGIYKKQDYRTKRGEIPVTKEQLVERIAEALGEPSINLESLEKASKTVLRKILFALDINAEESLKAK